MSVNGRDTLYRVNSGDVVHETIEGEVIAIDLARGSYYNLAGSGPRIWSQLVEGASAVSIAAGFEEAGEDIEQEVATLVERLAAESLIVEQPDGTCNAPAPVPEPVPFEPPRFEKYTDMQDYFLLDPIHEVDASGWPNRPPE